MNGAKQLLLLVGSAKQNRSTSEVLGRYVVDKLAESGFESETLFAHKILKSDEDKHKLLLSVSRADLVVLAFPLYVDCLPYPVINALELIAGNRQAGAGSKKQSLLCVVNCGFPEARQNDTAVAICRQFAREAGFEWLGGLALGAGEVINGRSLSEVKGQARNVIRSLDLAIDALADGKPVPERAVDLMARPLVPRWLYLLLGGSRWKRESKQHGVRERLSARPYQE
jgi:hypothetical protein